MLKTLFCKKRPTHLFNGWFHSGSISTQIGVKIQPFVWLLGWEKQGGPEVGLTIFIGPIWIKLHTGVYKDIKYPERSPEDILLKWPY